MNLQVFRDSQTFQGDNYKLQWSDISLKTMVRAFSKLYRIPAVSSRIVNEYKFIDNTTCRQHMCINKPVARSKCPQQLIVSGSYQIKLISNIQLIHLWRRTENEENTLFPLNSREAVSICCPMDVTCHFLSIWLNTVVHQPRPQLPEESMVNMRQEVTNARNIPCGVLLRTMRSLTNDD